MKVFHILYGNLGGHFEVVKNIIEGNDNKSIEPVLIFYSEKDLLDHYSDYCIKNNIEYHYVKKDSKFDILNHFRIWKMIKRTDDTKGIYFHILHSLPFIYFLRLGRNIKLIAVEHNAIKIKSRIEKILSFSAILFADKIVYLNEAYRNYYLDNYKRLLNINKTVVIPTGLKIVREYKHKSISGSDETHIGICCRMNNTKDVDTLIKAIHIVKNKNYKVKLHLAGDGEHLQKLKELTKALNLNDDCIFYGLLNKAGVEALLERLYIYVQATKAETFSISILEAAIFSLPVICANVPDVNKVFSEEEILFYQLKNESDLAGKIISVIENNLLAEKLSYNLNYKVVKNYDRKKMAERYLMLIG